MSSLFMRSASTAWAAGLVLVLLAAALNLSTAAATRQEAAPRQSELRLLKQAEPDYPAEARTFRIQGAVSLQALVGRDGKIRKVDVLDGHPALREAAAQAVEQWEYAPFVVNSRAYEVPTRIVVNFSLATE
jgi:TonB family protein